MASNKKIDKRRPPSKSVSNLQYSLFQNFVANDPAEVSNTIDVWESIPKYFFTPGLMDKLRTSDGLAKPYQWEYEHKDKRYKVKVQPALIEQEDGSYKAFFPSITEEIVEETLKKIFTDQLYGVHDVEKVESWVRFSLSMIHKELKERGKARNRLQIKHAIEVMSSCIITLYQDGQEVYKGSILSDLVTVNREEYLRDSNSHHVARLPVFVSHSINRLQYRQFNYGRLMECSDQLSRWLYKRLIHRYKQASMMNDYHFMYTDIVQSSGLLQMRSLQGNRRKLEAALDELKKRNVLQSYESDVRKEGRKIVDIKYTVITTRDFMTEQKAANKRNRENSEFALQSNLKTVDNS